MNSELKTQGTTLTIHPGSPLRGEVDLPGDKSLSHRAALLAALAEGESRAPHFLDAGVTRVMLNALTALGVEWALDGDCLRVRGRGLHGLCAPAAPLDCGNSATTLRLLAGALAAAGIPAELSGTPGLAKRPMQRLVEPLRQMGVPIEAAPGGTAPLRLAARDPQFLLRGGEIRLPVASAQLKSALLLAGLAAGEPLTVSEPGPSRDHTERMLAAAGVSIATEPDGEGSRITLIPPPDGHLAPFDRDLPGDFSSAAFLIVAALVTPGSEVRLRRVGLNPTRIGLLEALGEMGADIRVCDQQEVGGEPVGDLIVRASHLEGGRVEGSRVVRMIDEFPAFAIAAAYAASPTVVRQAEELRYKESDRIGQLCSGIRALGGEAVEAEDGFTIPGGRALSGGGVDVAGDHRLAMSFAVAGLASRGAVAVRGAESISESFPGFVEALTRLGAEITTGTEGPQ
jgi:3-phosphoshikimate 1-carboxyvinyltransferase